MTQISRVTVEVCALDNAVSGALTKVICQRIGIR